MNTVQWTCDECGTVNVIVLNETDLTVLTCRECGNDGKLSLAKPVVIVADEPVHHTG